MRIAFLCTSSLDYPSPRGRWLPVAQEFVRAGHTATLHMLHPTWDRLSIRESNEGQVDLRYVSQMHVYGYPGSRRALRPAELLAISFRSALALAASAIRSKAEIIQIAKPQPMNGLAGLLAARILGAPMFVDCDDYEAGANRFGAAWQRRMVQLWEDRLPRAANGVSVNTRFMQQYCEEHGVPAGHIYYVPNGLRAAQFDPPNPTDVQALRAKLGLESHPTLIYFGAISTIAHGVQLLLEAFAIALHQLPHARLLLVGDGDDRPALQAHSLNLGIGHAVIWTGNVAPTATRNYLALAQASCDPVADTPAMAARSPLKIVESLAQGIPVLTGNIGDRRELLGESSGLIVTPGDPAALAAGIVALLNDPNQRNIMAKAARQQAENLRWERIVEPWVRMIEARG